MYIIFTDVDGTMIDDNQILMKETLIDIQNAQTKGIKIALCTANSHLTNMNKLATTIKADFLITSDGSRIYDLKLKKVIDQEVINQKIANKFFQVLKKWSHYTNWTTEKGLYISVQTLDYKKQAIEINKKFHCKKSSFKFDNKIQEDVYIMTCYASKNKLNAIIEKAKEYKLNYLRHNDCYMSITPHNSNKGEAIKKLCLLKNIKLDNIMTIGNEINDLSMIKITQNSYAVANAIKVVKDNAHHHTSSVNQNGLGEAIVDFMFRKKL